MKKSFAFIVLLVACSILYAGPFGLEFGWTLGDMAANGIKVSNINEQGETIYCTAEVPYPHVDIDLYTLIIDKEYGLFQIIATAFGDSYIYDSGTQKIYSGLKEQLILKYGNPAYSLDEYYYDSFDPLNWDKEILLGKNLLEIWDLSDDPKMMQLILSTEVFDGIPSCCISYLANSWDAIDARNKKQGANVL